jgi:transposase
MRTIEPPPREEILALIEAHYTRKQIGKHFGVGQSTLMKWYSKYSLYGLSALGQRTAAIDVRRLREMVDAGMPSAAIGKEFGCCREAVIGALKREGLRTKKQAANDRAKEGYRHAFVNVTPSRRAIEMATPFGCGL